MKALRKVKDTAVRSELVKPSTVPLHLPSQSKGLFFEKQQNKIQSYLVSLQQAAYEKLYAYRDTGILRVSERYVYAYGHRGYLSGYFDDDTASLELTRDLFEKRRPGAVVLSGMSPFDLDVCMLQDEAYMKPLVLVEDRQAFAKQAMHELFKEVSACNSVFHRDTRFKSILVYEAHNKSRRNIIHVPLSIGMWGAEEEKTSVVLGAPHPLLVHEDLSLSIELDELKSIWKDLTETYMER